MHAGDVSGGYGTAARPGPGSGFSVRPVLAPDWQRLREIRLRALEQDADAFSSSHAQELTRPDEEWRSWAAASEAGIASRWFAGVDEQGRWQGVAAVYGYERSTSAGLFSMWVAPAVRGRGLAGALCQACSDWAAEHGYADIVLGVMAGNESALAAYRRAGFVEYDRFTEPRGERVLDLVMMRRELG